MKRGEVWRVRLTSSSGHVQSGDRPALIVQATPLSTNLPTVLVVPFTSSQRAARFAGTVPVLPDASNGLTCPSIALAFQVRAIDKRDLAQRLGEIADSTLQQILDTLESLVGR